LLPDAVCQDFRRFGPCERAVKYLALKAACMTTRPSLLLSGAALALILSPALAGCDTGPTDPFAAAQEAYANGEPRTALDLIGQAIEMDPDNPEIRMLAGDAAIALGMLDRAIAEFERVPSTATNYSLAQAKLAEAQVMANYMQAAQETIDGLTLDNALAYSVQIMFHFAQGDADEGFAILDRGLEVFPEDPRLVTVDAERLWANGKADETFARLESVLAIKPAVHQAHLFAGQLRLGMNEAPAAEAHFEQVLSVRPLHQTAMLAMAAIARDRGDTQAASNWINKINESGAPHPIGMLFAAQMAFDAGEVDRAFALVEQAPPAFSNAPEFARLRGMIDAAREQHAMAALALGDYVAATGGDPIARQVLANSLAEQGEFDKAWEAIGPVVDHPQMEGAGLVLALALSERTGKGNPAQLRAMIERRDNAPSIGEEMREAGAAIRAGDWAKADGIYAPLVDGRGKSDPALLNNAAAVKTKLGEHGAAVALARRALAVAPSSPEIMDTLGWALWQQGSNRAEARAMLSRARDAAPNSSEIAEHWTIAHAD